MKFEIKDFNVKSSDNIHILKGKLYVPKGEIKALFHVVHGMTEHIDRYDFLMSSLAKRGVLAFGFDNLGHGETAINDTELGFIASENGDLYLAEDVKLFADAVKEEYKELPYYLFGHSMGSFIVRMTALKYPEGIKKLIICGTAGPNPLAGIGILLAKMLKKKKGEKSYSPFLENMAFGTYNKRFTEDDKYAWLTKDLEIIKAYKQNKYCTFSFTVSALLDLVTIMKNCNSKGWFKEISANLPILLIAGGDDPVGNCGSGVFAVYSRLKSYKKNAAVKIYENCRHEILNDDCKDEVLEDIIKFCEF